MMYLSHWYCIYRTLRSWNCLQVFTLLSIVLLYETTRWVPKNILNLSINSSLNWSTLTSVQTSIMAAPEKCLKQGSLYGFKFIKTRDWMKTMKQATTKCRIYIFILISKVLILHFQGKYKILGDKHDDTWPTNVDTSILIDWQLTLK